MVLITTVRVKCTSGTNLHTGIGAGTKNRFNKNRPWWWSLRHLLQKKYNNNDNDKLERVQERKKDEVNGNAVIFNLIFNLIIMFGFDVSPSGQK